MLPVLRLVGIGALVAMVAGCVHDLPSPASGSSTNSGIPTSYFPTSWDGSKLADMPAQNSAQGNQGQASGGQNQGQGQGQPQSNPNDPHAKQGAPQRTTYVVIVGIEVYRDIPKAPGANKDAAWMEWAFQNAFGIPAENEKLLVDDKATRSDIIQALDWLVASVPAGGRGYFYFSGHGTPAVKDAAPMIVPYEASETGLATAGIPLSEVYQRLSATRGREAIAFLDSCFSGAGGRSILPKGARPLLRVKEVAPKTSLAVFAAASGSETSGPTKDGTQGLFTRSLAAGLGGGEADLDGDGQITLAELKEYVAPRVVREAKQDGRDQHPSLTVGTGIDPKNLALVWGQR